MSIAGRSRLAVLLSIALIPVGSLRPAEDAGYRLDRDIPYRDGDAADPARERCRLDVYHPAGAKGFATVVWFHGGGLTGGSRSVPEGLKGKGIAVVAAGYRLAPSAKPPAYIEDAAAAVAWTFRNIGRYGGAADRIFVAGHSAGGYLTSMVGLDRRWLGAHGLDANAIAGLVPLSGQAITHFTIRAERGIPDRQPVVDDLAPLFHVRKDAPPMLLVTGDRERELLGRYEENAYLWRMMKVAGHPSTDLRELPGLDHGGMAEPGLALLLEFIARTRPRAAPATPAAPPATPVTPARSDGGGEDWAMGPFVKRDEPILRPTPDSRFKCPVRGKEVRWEEQNVYNPAAVVRDGEVHIFYRADDRSPDLGWGRTCRIGMARSGDGIRFARHPEPVLYPDEDVWKEHEWEGGCEDLHIAEGEDGLYSMNYTTWNGHRDTMSIAVSRDLLHWTKRGPAFRKAGKAEGRSGVVLTRLVDGRLVAARIDGKYWMYYTHPCALAWSEDLVDWTPLGKAVWSGGHEAGAVALLGDEGILVMFNTGDWGSKGAWTLGQALLRRDDRTTVLRHAAEPFLFPEREWERKGFTDGTVVANALVPFKGRWLLYYGAADRCIGLAVFEPGAGSPFSL